MKPSVKRKALTKITPKLGSLILQSQKQIPTSLFSQNSNFFKKDARGNFIGFCIKTFAILCAENLVKKEDDENDGVPVEAPEDDQECVDDLQSIIMADLDILKDKKFYDYLLQSLNDHRGKLDGFDNVTMRPEFTQEFFASYWLDLMKCAHFDNVPLVTVEDHDHQGKIVNGFDSIHRSLFEVCESRIDLRLTTRFVITGIKLADEEETALRNLFMLILLFVSEWVADQQEDCPHITLKQPMARLVHACFSKLFKDIYYGKDESFKNFIFDENKENSPPFLFSPNRSFNTSDLSGFNITPNVQRHNEIENETILDRLSETNEALMKAVNLKTDKERKLLADYKHLQETINAQTLEMVAIKKLNDEYSEEKQSLQHNLVKTKNELIQIETEKKNEIVSLNNTVSELQMHQDLLKNQLANATLETDNLKNDIDDLTEVVSVHKKNREELEEENKALQNVIDANVLEFETNSNKLYEEKKRLEEDLSKTQREMVAIKKLNDEYSEEKQSLQHNLVKTKNELIQIEIEKKNEIESLNNTISELQMHQDLLKNQLANATLETHNLKNDIDDLTEVVSVHNSVAAIANNNSLKTRDVATSTQQENRQKTSSCIPSCLMFFLFLILFFTMWIYAFGAIVPSWAYIQVHHDHLPPQ